MPKVSSISWAERVGRGCSGTVVPTLKPASESLEGLLEHRWPRTHPPAPDSKVRGSPRIYIPNKFVVMLVLPVQGLHFENHCSGQREQHGQRIEMAV